MRDAGSQPGHVRIDGSVTAAKKSELVHQFQSDKNVRVALLSITAAGVCARLLSVRKMTVPTNSTRLMLAAPSLLSFAKHGAWAQMSIT